MSFPGLTPPPFFLATPIRPPLPWQQWEQMFNLYLVASVASECLSFYSLAKSPRGGSLSPGLLDSLLSAEEALVENEKHDDVVTMDAVEVAVDHADYVEKRSDPRLVYYIAGYVARKRILSTNCTACRDACLMPKDSVSGEVPADASKEWDLGGLLYPAVSLYHLIECLESRLTREFSRTNLHSKAALSILGKVKRKRPDPKSRDFPAPPGPECSGLCDLPGAENFPEDSPTKQFYKDKVLSSQEEITQLKKKVKTLQQTKRRLVKRNESAQEIIKEIREQKLLSEEGSHVFSSVFSG
ncbi:hypothetical protein MRX96_050946 [Rhipicephalus microplus]